MNVKDLKIEFRYLTGNIACMSVDSVNGNPVHNDIDNEEAIILFNSLVGEKEGCQTLKTLLKENQELKKKYENAVADYEYEKSKNQRAIEYIEKYDVFKEFYFPLMKRVEENQVKSSIKYEFDTSIKKNLLEILKEDNKEEIWDKD